MASPGGYPHPGASGQPAGHGYQPDVTGQAGLAGQPHQGRRVFDTPASTGEYQTGEYATGEYQTGEYATGEYQTGEYQTGEYATGRYQTGEYATGQYSSGEFARPDWQQPAGWAPTGTTGSNGSPDPGGRQGWPASGWETGPQPVQGAAATQGWATGEQPRQDFGQDYGQSGQGYGREYGHSPQGYGQGGQGYGQGYERGYESPGYQGAAYGHEQQAGGPAHPAYQPETTDPRWPAVASGAAWGQGSAYGNAAATGSALTQSPSAFAGASTGGAYSGEWPMAAGGRHRSEPIPVEHPFGESGYDTGGFDSPRRAGHDDTAAGQEGNSLAKAALALAVVGLVVPVVPAVIALVLASKAARRIRESNGAIGGQGTVSAARGVASVALVLAVVGAVTVAVMLGLRDDAPEGGGTAADPGNRSSAAAGEPGGESQEPAARIVALEIGQCIEDTPRTEVRDVKVIECSERHESEVFANVRIDDDELPSETALDNLAKKDCVASFKSYVGRDYNSSKLNIRYFTPTEESWAAGDRTITCTLTGGTPGEKLTGSKRDSNE